MYDASGHLPPLPAMNPKTGLATTSLVLGLLSIPTLCVCVGPLVGFVAMVLGLIALFLAVSKPQEYAGGGRATVGLVSGALTSVVLLTVIVVTIVTGSVVYVAERLATSATPVVGDLGRMFVAHSQLAMIDTALREYQQAHGDFPRSARELLDTPVLRGHPYAHLLQDTSAIQFFADMDPNDPPKWPIAFIPLTWLGNDVVAALYRDGEIAMPTRADFEAELETVAKEFEAARGRPYPLSPTRVDTREASPVEAEGPEDESP